MSCYFHKEGIVAGLPLACTACQCIDMVWCISAQYSFLAVDMGIDSFYWVCSDDQIDHQMDCAFAVFVVAGHC